MRGFALVILLLIFSSNSFGQTLFATEYSNGIEKVIKIKNGSVQKYSGAVKGFYWDTGKNDRELLTGKQNFLILNKLGDSGVEGVDTVFAFENEIWGITIQYPDAYIVTSSSEEAFYKNSNLHYLNLISLKTHEVSLPDSLNFLNINLSPNRKYLSFIHTQQIEDPEATTYYYMLYDIKRNSFTAFDTADYFEEEWFAGFDDGPMSSWVNGNKIFYHKRTKEYPNGSVISFSLKSKNLKKEVSIPLESKRLNSFAVSGECAYFIDKAKGEKPKIFVFNIDRNEKREIYEVPEKGDFLLNTIRIK